MREFNPIVTEPLEERIANIRNDLAEYPYPPEKDGYKAYQSNLAYGIAQVAHSYCIGDNPEEAKHVLRIASADLYARSKDSLPEVLYELNKNLKTTWISVPKVLRFLCPKEYRLAAEVFDIFKNEPDTIEIYQMFEEAKQYATTPAQASPLAIEMQKVTSPLNVFNKVPVLAL